MQFQKGKIEESKIGNYMGERKTFYFVWSSNEIKYILTGKTLSLYFDSKFSPYYLDYFTSFSTG